jgi:hypothetical protein
MFLSFFFVSFIRVSDKILKYFKYTEKKVLAPHIYECDYDTLKCSFYTQWLISTRTSVISTRTRLVSTRKVEFPPAEFVILTLTSVIKTHSSVIYTRRV